MNMFGWLAVSLTTLFIGLKLTGFISWAWWIVLFPVYGPLAVGVVLIALTFAGAVIIGKRY